MALSSSISHSLKTFCVIPHLVRDDEAFEAVHEDYIVYDASGKILNFDFSAVLSPAHNLSHSILAPLFHVIRDRRQDAALLVACPGSSGEASTVALDLFANMLPLLFRAVPNAPIAHISVVEVQRDGKTLTDLYRMTKVHGLHELDTEEVLRASANEAWGGVMELVAQRGSWTNDGESAVLVLIRLEGYATLMVGDIGSSAEILSHVNLTLRSSDIFERSGRTIAPRVPIARLLQPCATQPGSIVHVVLVPDPMTSPKQTLRLLHFGSNLMKDITLADTTPAAQNVPPPSQRQPASLPTTTTTNHSHFETEYDVTTSSSVSLGAAATSTRREDFSSISFSGGGGASMTTPSSTRRKPAGRVPSPAATAGGFFFSLMKDITLADTTPASQNFPQRQPASQPTTTNHSHFENEYDVTTSSSVSLGAAAATSSTRREDFSSISFNGGGGASMTPSSTRRKPAAGRVPSPAATAGGGRKPAPLTQEAQHQSWRDEIVHGLLAASSSSASGGGGVQQQQQQQQQQHYGGVGGPYDGSSSMLVITPSQREQQFAQKVTTLDKIAKDQKQKILALQNELKRTQGELNDAKHEADTCRTEAAELKSDAEHARKEQKDAAELVATLLKRISGMEQITSSGNNEATDLRRRNDDLVSAARKLEEQLSHATHKLRSLEKKEILRLRESTLDRITAPVSSSSPMRGHAAANAKRNHNNTAKTPKRDSEANARKTRNADDSVQGEDHHNNNEDDGNVTWDQNSLLHSIKQMRDRCAKLESENHDLRLKHQQEEAFRHAVSDLEGGGGGGAHHHDHGDMVTSPPQSHNHKRQHEKDLHQHQAGSGGGGTPPKSRRSALDELHKRMTQRDITDEEEDEASSPPTSPVHHGSQQQQHRVVSQYLEKERALLKKQVQQ
ncbi:Hypothetical protein, putative, partial [Bodo saltans]